MKILATIFWCAAHLPGNFCAVEQWNFVTENSAGSGTLLSSGGDDYHSADECRAGFVRYQKMNSEYWPGTLKLAYCHNPRTNERLVLWTPTSD